MSKKKINRDIKSGISLESLEQQPLLLIAILPWIASMIYRLLQHFAFVINDPIPPSAVLKIRINLKKKLKT